MASGISAASGINNSSRSFAWPPADKSKTVTLKTTKNNAFDLVGATKITIKNVLEEFRYEIPTFNVLEVSLVWIGVDVSTRDEKTGEECRISGKAIIRKSPRLFRVYSQYLPVEIKVLASCEIRIPHENIDVFCIWRWKIISPIPKFPSNKTRKRYKNKKVKTLERSKIPEKQSYKCSLCSAKFLLLRNFVHHKASEHSVKSRGFRCLRCHKRFFRKSSYLQHHQMRHRNLTKRRKPPPEKEFKCNPCGREFTSQRSASRHQELHTFTEDIIFECLERGQSPLYSGELKKQQREGKVFQQQGEGKNRGRDTANGPNGQAGSTPPPVNQPEKESKNHICVYCGKIFTAAKFLKRHSALHSDQRPFPCNQCDRAFRSEYLRKLHLRIHTGERPYSCECGKSFQRQDHLKRHALVHTGSKKFHCDICNNNFSQKDALKKHLLLHSGEKHHVCPICSKSFAFPSSLTQHMRHHTQEKPYHCDLCSRSFALLKTMKNHRRTHTGEKPFVCHICGKSFIKNSNMKRHQQVHSKESKKSGKNKEKPPSCCYLPITPLLSGTDPVENIRHQFAEVVDVLYFKGSDINDLPVLTAPESPTRGLLLGEDEQPLNMVELYCEIP